MKTSISLATILAKFPELLGDLVGDAQTQINEIQPASHAEQNSLVFAIDDKLTDLALACPAHAIVLPLKTKPRVEKSLPAGKTVIFSSNVKLAMALIKREYFTHEIPLQTLGTIHSTAVIDSTVRLGKNVSIGPFCVVGRDVVIADDVRLDANVVVEAETQIGRGSHLQSHLYIGPRTEIGERCLLMPHSTIGAEGFGFAPDQRGHFHRIPHSGKVILHNDVEIGANCTIDRGTFGATVIGEGTKIDKISHIAHNCEIGKHCAMAGKFAMAGSGKVGDHVIAGGRVTIKDGARVASKVEIAGLTGVQSDITEAGGYGGFPVQPVRGFMRTSASLPHLPRLRRDVARVLKHLGLASEE